MSARMLRTLEEIREAGAAAVRDWPPLEDEEIEPLCVLIAPAFERTREPDQAA